MRLTQLVLSGLAGLALTVFAGTALAQDAAPAAQERDPKDNWLKVCETLESGEQHCIMRQLILAAGRFNGSLVININPASESRIMVIGAVPLGVMLPLGMSWEIDGNPVFRAALNYIACDPRSCFTQFPANENFINALKRGAKLKLVAKNRRNEDVVVDIDLAGFTAVYDGEDHLTFEQFRNQSSGQTQLENSLQELANQRSDSQ